MLLTWWASHRRNRLVMWLAAKELAEFWCLCGGTSSWPDPCSPIRCTFERRSVLFRACHQSMRPGGAAGIRCIRDRNLVLRVSPPAQRTSTERPSTVYNWSNCCDAKTEAHRRSLAGTCSTGLRAWVGIECVWTGWYSAVTIRCLCLPNSPEDRNRMRERGDYAAARRD